MFSPTLIDRLTASHCTDDEKKKLLDSGLARQENWSWLNSEAFSLQQKADFIVLTSHFTSAQHIELFSLLKQLSGDARSQAVRQPVPQTTLANEICLQETSESFRAFKLLLPILMIPEDVSSINLKSPRRRLIEGFKVEAIDILLNEKLNGITDLQEKFKTFSALEAAIKEFSSIPFKYQALEERNPARHKEIGAIQPVINAAYEAYEKDPLSGLALTGLIAEMREIQKKVHVSHIEEKSTLAFFFNFLSPASRLEKMIGDAVFKSEAP